MTPHGWVYVSIHGDRRARPHSPASTADPEAVHNLPVESLSSPNLASFCILLSL